MLIASILEDDSLRKGGHPLQWADNDFKRCSLYDADFRGGIMLNRDGFSDQDAERLIVNVEKVFFDIETAGVDPAVRVVMRAIAERAKKWGQKDYLVSAPLAKKLGSDFHKLMRLIIEERTPGSGL